MQPFCFRSGLSFNSSAMGIRVSVLLLLMCCVGDNITSAQQQAVLDNPNPTDADDTARFTLPDSNDGLPGQGTIRRQDWFRNLWRTRRSKWAETSDQDQHAVVFLGDSITQGWESSMAEQFGDLHVANRGISGDTTRGMLLRLDEDVLSLAPKGVVMLMGTNDLEEGDSPESVAANVQQILDRLLASDEQLSIVLCQVFPSSASKKRPADKIQDINRRYAQLVRDRPRVTLVDTWTLFANKSGDAKPEEFPDLLHPNAIGYTKWGAAIRPVFATLGWTETTADEMELEPGFVSIFNGHDLTGWGYRVTSEKDRKTAQRLTEKMAGQLVWPIFDQAESFEGLTTSSDGRYEAKHGRLIVKTPSEGRRIQTIWTTREFNQDFTLKLEFRATPNADSGVFVRDKQIQCRDYPLAGPYHEIKNYRTGDWNELEIQVVGNVAKCTCNGEVLEDGVKVPASGSIGLEGDRGQMEYRRIRIQMH